LSSHALYAVLAADVAFLALVRASSVVVLRASQSALVDSALQFVGSAAYKVSY